MSERVEVTGGPWPERIGCRGVTVDPPRQVYPWAGLGHDEVVVKLDDDPVGGGRSRGREWSCVYRWSSIRKAEVG